MNLWIRSQDREKITKVNSVNISEFQDSITICGSIDGINLFSLASYKTKERALEVLKERALEVLDEIQSLLKEQVNLGVFIIDNKFTSRVYEMPKE